LAGGKGVKGKEKSELYGGRKLEGLFGERGAVAPAIVKQKRGLNAHKRKGRSTIPVKSSPTLQRGGGRGREKVEER